KKQKTDLAHVRAVIKIVEPNFEISSIKPTRPRIENPWFKRGEAWLCALALLREATEPLTLSEIAKGILAAKGVRNPTKAELRFTRTTIIGTLNLHNGKTVQSVGRIRARRWELLR